MRYESVQEERGREVQEVWEREVQQQERESERLESERSKPFTANFYTFAWASMPLLHSTSNSVDSGCSHYFYN